MSMFEIYGNAENIKLIKTMKKYQHFPHACLFYGEKGSGRKTLAKYFAMTALCHEKHAPCGECRNCRKILHDTHPDFIFVEHSGKKQGFSVDTVKKICHDAIVAPNDDNLKIYLFTDCDSISIPAQNTLLKLTEEPPEHVILLFTAEQKTVFLDTMLSRMMQIAVNPCSQEDCKTALLAQGKNIPDTEKAVNACGGNIGKALDWLENEDMQELTKQVANFTNAIATRKYYEILKILYFYEKDRQQALEFLKLLNLQVRDALVIKYQSNFLMGCDKTSAQALASVLTVSRAIELQNFIRNAYLAIDSNVSVKLALSAFGGNLL
ncbi:MAG: hypothetical protein K2J88_06595 [Oscillospiraceae bacterium]|nr:hypothetical protein [Oscillospiraceae bacterium]